MSARLSARSLRSWRGLVALGLAAALLAAGTLGLARVWRADEAKFEEFRIADAGGGTPVAIAAGGDGVVWFTMDSSDALGRVRDGRIERIPKGAESIEPLGLAVDSSGHAWFTEAPKQRIGRAAPDGVTASFALGTQVARLGRLATGADGAVWFAESTVGSITRLHDGVFTRHVMGALDAALPADAMPFAIAVAPDGAVWATLPAADKLVRLAPDGTAKAFDVPTRRGGLGDIAVGKDGTVYFVQIGANKIGRFAGGRFEEFAVPTPGAAITGLAVAPDGAAWFTELRGHKIGRLHNGTIREFVLPRPDARPFGIAVDPANNVWYADLSGWIGKLHGEGARGR